MSGGHWSYMGREFSENFRKTAELWRLMAAIEHELDWGICADTCLRCARARTVVAIEAFFDSGCTDATVAVALVNDRSQNRCQQCRGE